MKGQIFIRRNSAPFCTRPQGLWKSTWREELLCVERDAPSPYASTPPRPPPGVQERVEGGNRTPAAPSPDRGRRRGAPGLDRIYRGRLLPPTPGPYRGGACVLRANVVQGSATPGVGRTAILPPVGQLGVDVVVFRDAPAHVTTNSVPSGLLVFGDHTVEGPAEVVGAVARSVRWPARAPGFPSCSEFLLLSPPTEDGRHRRGQAIVLSQLESVLRGLAELRVQAAESYQLGSCW